jgi:hypothetical protein
MMRTQLLDIFSDFCRWRARAALARAKTAAGRAQRWIAREHSILQKVFPDDDDQR